MRIRWRLHRRIHKIKDALSFGIAATLKDSGSPQQIDTEAVADTFQ